MKFIVSLCNAADREGRVLLLVGVGGECTAMDYRRTGVTSACGLAQDAGFIYSACNIAEDSMLAVFDRRTLVLEEFLPLTPARDVHSIVIDGDAVIAVSTGTDEVLRIPIGGGAADVLWRATRERRETHHLNAVVWSGSSLLCSAFGPKSGERWSSACDGYVYDVGSSTVRRRGLYHPHSLTVANGELYLCESSRGAVLDSTGERGIFDGYTRGLAFAADGTCVVATSIGRASAPETSIVGNPADPGLPRGRCGLHVCAPEPRLRPLAQVDISPYGNEIYDVLALNE